MSAFFPPGSPPQDVLGAQIGNLLARVRALEASTGGAGGLQFNSGTYGPLNIGDWLHVNVDGVDSGSGFGMLLESSGDGGIAIQCNDDGPLELSVSGDGGLLIEDDGNGVLQILHSGQGGTHILDTGLLGMLIETGDVNGPLTIQADGGIITIKSTGDDVIIETGFRMFLKNLPTSAAGLPAEAIWNNGGVVNIV